ncbi:MAG: hypothetical protein V4616_07835, partial [Bacteroidota bacterium]
TGSHLGNTTDLINVFSASEQPQGTAFSYKVGRPMQQLGHELLKFRTTYTLKNFNTLSLVYSRQFNKRFEFDRHGP